MRELVCCRICGSPGLIPFFDMGTMPLANGLLDSPDAPEERYPLKVLSCERCGLVQLSHVVPAETLFAHDYPFFTGSSAVMSRHFIDLMDEHAASLPANALVVEIGSNDGTALRGTNRKDLRLYGVDPADNMPWYQPEACRIGACFTETLVKEHLLPRHGKASLIVACNVLGHVDNLHDFMRGVTALLDDGGAFVFEVPYFGDTLEHGNFDQIYAEHVSYLAIHPVQILLEDHGMRMSDARRFPSIHGGTIRCTAYRDGADALHDCGSGGVPHSMAMNEMGWLFSQERLAVFATRAQASRDRLCDKLLSLKADGKSIIAYGASAKGAVVLNYCGIGTDLVPLVIDSTSVKQGKYVPGTHQEIVPPSYRKGGVSLNDYDAVLLLAWNHRAEIVAKHPEFVGEWILPHGEA